MSSDPGRKLEDAAALIHEDARVMGKTIADELREEGFQKGAAHGAALVRALQNRPSGPSALVGLFSRVAEEVESPSDKLDLAAELIERHLRIRRKPIADRLREEAYKNGLARGAERGVTEGVITGTVELLLRLVRKRLGTIPPTAEERIRGADLYTLDRWAERLLTATTIDQVFD